MPLRIPVVEMVEIGAGGGSIATVDNLGRVRAGPQSTGSEPGPASYGRGGQLPTVTDANVVLGRIQPALFAGGSMPLDRAAAATALEEQVGRPTGFASAEICATAVANIVEENMASATRVHAGEQGREIAAHSLIVFGGSAPVHAAFLADKLNLDHIVVPIDAGVGSALGFLRAPVSYEVRGCATSSPSPLPPPSVTGLWLTRLWKIHWCVRYLFTRRWSRRSTSGLTCSSALTAAARRCCRAWVGPLMRCEWRPRQW